MSEGILGQLITSGTTPQVVYTAPADRYVKCNITNICLTPNVLTNLYISAADTPTDAECINTFVSTTTNNGFERTAIILSPNERVVIKSSQAGSVCSITGTTHNQLPSSEFAGRFANALINTNTNTTIYTVPSGKTAVVNISATIADSATVGEVSLYIADVDTPVNDEIQNKEQFSLSKISGFERSGIVLNDGKKIVIKTENLTGKIAVRVHGASRNER